MNTPEKDRLALGIQQPWAELILKGIKTIEVRNVRVAAGRRVYLYSSRKVSNLVAAQKASFAYDLDIHHLPVGQIVGSIDIVECRKSVASDSELACVPFEFMFGKQSWVLANPTRCNPPLVPERCPYGTWFYPFR